MKNNTLSIKDIYKARTGLFTVCAIMLLTIFLITGCVTKIESQEVQTRESGYLLFDFNHIEDFSEHLQSLGLTNIHGPNGDPHLDRLSQEQSVLISSESDVDVLLALARFVVEEELDGLTWESCVDDALNEAGLYDYWKAGFSEITLSAREQEIIDMATSLTIEELMDVFYRRPELLAEFQELGYLQDVVLEDSNADVK